MNLRAFFTFIGSTGWHREVYRLRMPYGVRGMRHVRDWWLLDHVLAGCKRSAAAIGDRPQFAGVCFCKTAKSPINGDCPQFGGGMR